MVSAAAAATKNLTFGITHSVTYGEQGKEDVSSVMMALGSPTFWPRTADAPYALARRFSTLDHLTKGRIALNVVTSYLDSAARNFGLKEQVEHDERYRRAEEYMK